MNTRLTLLAVLLLGFLGIISAGNWSQINYDWKQQNAAPFVGPEKFSSPSVKTVIQSAQTFLPVVNNAGVIYVGISNLITALNSSSLSKIWEQPAHVRYSSYRFYGGAVNSQGSLVVGVGPTTTKYIQSFLQISSNGTLENQLEITFDGLGFFLGPNDEIIVNGTSTFYIATNSSAGVLPGNPLAADDAGNLYVSNSTGSSYGIYKTNLSAPDQISWSMTFEDRVSVQDVAVSVDQSALIVLTTANSQSRTFYVLSIDQETGAVNWVFTYQNAYYPGKIGVSGQYIIATFSSTTLSSWGQLTLSSEGYLLNTLYNAFSSPVFSIDSNSIIFGSGYADYYYNINVLAVSPTDGIISNGSVSNSGCSSYDGSINNLFFTNSTGIWLSHCNFVYISSSK